LLVSLAMFPDPEVATTSPFSCAGWRGFCAPSSRSCLLHRRAPNRPENHPSTVLHRRLRSDGLLERNHLAGQHGDPINLVSRPQPSPHPGLALAPCALIFDCSARSTQGGSSRIGGTLSKTGFLTDDDITFRRCASRSGSLLVEPADSERYVVVGQRRAGSRRGPDFRSRLVIIPFAPIPDGLHFGRNLDG
jgi:hypothetical protein